LPSKPLRDKSGFKDYCLVLRVHPAADAAMIDAAYWHLAKRYSAIDDDRSRKRLEELNEAYAVLGSPKRKDGYLTLRAEVLGVDALPVPPAPETDELPLTVMKRQKLRPQRKVQAEDEDEEPAAYWPGALTSVLAIPIVLALAIAAFLAGAPVLMVAVLLVSGLLLMAAPLLPGLLRLRRSAPSLRGVLPNMPTKLPRPHREPKEGAAITPIDTARLKSSADSRTQQLRRKTAAAETPVAEPPSLNDPRD
jgi:hypothetical protein